MFGIPVSASLLERRVRRKKLYRVVKVFKEYAGGTMLPSFKCVTRRTRNSFAAWRNFKFSRKAFRTRYANIDYE